MHIVLGISTIVLLMCAFYFATKAYGNTEPRGGGFFAALMLGGMAGRERFTQRGWQFRNRAMISQSLAVVAAIGWWVTQ
jgi:hypothetical protein